MVESMLEVVESLLALSRNLLAVVERLLAPSFGVRTRKFARRGGHSSQTLRMKPLTVGSVGSGVMAWSCVCVGGSGWL